MKYILYNNKVNNEFKLCNVLSNFFEFETDIELICYIYWTNVYRHSSRYTRSIFESVISFWGINVKSRFNEKFEKHTISWMLTNRIAWY